MGSSIRPEPPKKKRGAFTDLAEQLAAPQAVAADAMEGKPAPAGAFSDLASQMQYTPSQPDGFTVGDAAKMAGQGAAFGWGDELAAAMQAGDQSPSGYARLFSGVVKAFKGDPAYTQAHESNEAELSRIREANPKSAMAAEIGGGVATSLAGAGILKAMGILPAAEATVAGRIAQGAKIGAAQGAIAGAGNASEGNRTLGAGLGAGAGAIVGGAVPAIGEGVKRAGGFAADALKLRVPSTVSGEAPSWLQRALQKAPGSPLPGVQSVDDRAVDLTRRTATKGGK